MVQAMDLSLRVQTPEPAKDRLGVLKAGRWILRSRKAMRVTAKATTNMPKTAINIIDVGATDNKSFLLVSYVD